MARSPKGPPAPRVSPPDLPRELGAAEPLRPHAEAFQVRWDDVEKNTDASHADITECAIGAASVDRFVLTGATLVDVEIAALRATAVSARESRWRRVRVTGGRIGTLDLTGAELDEVELRGIRIDYLSLAAAGAQDLLIADCVIGTLDLPQATMSRVEFRDTRADEVDTRAMRADGLDLRGLAAGHYLDVGSLRGATLSLAQVEALAGAFATAQGVDVRD